MMRSHRPTVAAAALAVTAVTVLLVSGCSSNDGTTSPSGAGGSASAAATAACVTKASNYLKSWDTFPTTLPASPPARYMPLPTKPAAGKTIDYITQNFPAPIASATAAATAAKSIGWTVKTITYDTTLPDYIAKFESAIQTKPDFIVEGGLPAASFQQQIAQAKAAGINVIIADTSEAPVSVPGFSAVVSGGGTQKQIADVQAYQVLADSHCNAHVAIFTLDYPIITLGNNEFTDVLKQNCPACSVKSILIQSQDIGTPAMTSQEVAALQGNPNIKYAYTAIGNVQDGLPQSLRVAGVTGIKIFGQNPDNSSIAALRDGTNAWWVNQASAVQGYDFVDAAVRVTATGKVVQDTGGYPLALITPQNVPSGIDMPVIPSNILSLYEKLWNPGS
jgi:ABC-type sugar transport system substrate-binding protein